jgi:hypothetical protein
MPRQRWRGFLRRYLNGRGLYRTSEEGRTVHLWLTRELREERPPGWRGRLPAAVDLAREIYQSFTDAFQAFYYAPDCPGPGHVRRCLERRFGYAEDQAVEGVHNRILKRRLRLLNHCRRRYQPSLFAARTFDASRLPGYLVRVARFESLHVPEDEPATGAIEDWGSISEAPREDGGKEEIDYYLLARKLAAYWGPENGFRPAHRLEGLITRGLGLATDNEELHGRCRAFLEARLPEWERGYQRLDRRASRLLARREDLEDRTRASGGDPAEQERLRRRLEGVEDDLLRLRWRRQRHRARLWPRLEEVERLLDGFVPQHRAGSLRHQRINREIALLESRVRQGRDRLLPLATGLPNDLRRLLERDVLAHLEMKPTSSRVHGLAKDERKRRKQDEGRWRMAGGRLALRVRAELRALWGGCSLPAGLRQALVYWLADVEDLYDFGVLTRKGIVEGLGRRHGWRLERLMRTG